MKTVLDCALLLSLAFGALRATGVKGEAFQAGAHLFVGALIGGWIFDKVRRREYAGLVIALSVLETACFFLVR